MKMIPVLIYDSRSEQELITQTDKVPETKIVKTPGFTLKGVSFTLKENVILIHYRFNEVHSESSSFRKVVYPEGPIDERVLDDLIELCWTTLYEEYVWYMKVPRSQIAPYPEDAVLDTFENGEYVYLKISDSYKPMMTVRFEETQNKEGGYYGITRALGFADRYKEFSAFQANPLPADCKIIQDTRESTPIKLSIPTIEDTVSVGDYRLADPHDNKIRIERKSLADF